VKSGASAAKAVAEKGAALIASMKVPPVVGGYSAIRSELDPMPLLMTLHGEGHRIALPRSNDDGTLSFLEWRPGDALQPGKLGVREPNTESTALEPAVILAPLLAFDRRGNRLGYGAGYYDRALRRLRSVHPTIAIGLAFDEQEFEEIPAEPQDEPLDMILTPARVVACGV
jgi:5-formyltetrahydrofolate cyclo-ligase